jgi:hypothetical protein
MSDKNLFFPLFFLLLALILITGCGGSSISPAPVTTVTPVPTATPTPGNTVILPDRETTVTVGQALVHFQTGSVLSQVTFTGGVANITPQLPLGAGISSSVYSFSLSNPALYNPLMPAYVTLPVTGSTANATVFHSSNGTTWVDIGGTVSGNTISVNVPSFSYFVVSTPVTGPTATPGSRNKLFFLHHSVGDGLIMEGNIRPVVTSYNNINGTAYTFWDHGYNSDGLRNPAGQFLGTSFPVPNDNTDPDGLHYLFTSSNADAVSARNQMMEYDVIAFKSCFPSSAIPDQDTLNQRKTWYLEMRNFFDLHPEKIFVVMSSPPLHRLDTNSTDAANARAFANWLKSSEYLGGHANVLCFDLFNYLAGGDNMLNYAYERSHYDGDSHPNTLGNQDVGPIFAQFLIDSAKK